MELAYRYGIDAVNFKMLLSNYITPFVGNPARVKELMDIRKQIDPLNNEKICSQILTWLDEAESKATQYGIRIKDHVRSPIFDRYPQLLTFEDKSMQSKGEYSFRS